MAIEARVVLTHHGCYSERLAAGVGVVHVGGDARRCLALVRGGSAAARMAVLADMARSFGTPPEVLETERDRLLVRCHCGTSGLTARLMALGATVLWPLVHADGRERFRFVAPDEEVLSAVSRLLETQGRFELVRAAEGQGLMGPASSDALAEALSPRQREALSLAIERGYYRQPRGARIEDLAREMGVSRSTFQEHLHKAERAAMASLGDALRIGRVPA